MRLNHMRTERKETIGGKKPLGVRKRNQRRKKTTTTTKNVNKKTKEYLLILLPCAIFFLSTSRRFGTRTYQIAMQKNCIKKQMNERKVRKKLIPSVFSLYY